MARILYGVHGTGHGHAMRALTLARKLAQHDFLFVANDDALNVLQPEFPVYRLPNLGTVFRNYKVDFLATIGRAIPLLVQRERYLEQLAGVIRDFAPDVCMTDLEYFVPRAAERAGLPCLTLDHQHIITCCRHQLPRNLLWDTLIQGLTPRYLFRPTEANLLVSFYAPPLLPRYHARIVPPLLRDTVLKLSPHDEGHVLVYQSNSTHTALIDFLRTATRRTCYVFGYGQSEGHLDNVYFMPKSEEGFLNLLASCTYVVQGGSHTLMSEALYLGKPILSLPLGAMVEQRYNALYLERLGYGVAANMHSLTSDLLANFEDNLPTYQSAIEQGKFLGNALIYELVDRFAQTGKLDLGEVNKTSHIA
ncbi:MAG: teichoic acid biosynthesis protein [Desulfovibrio sp.]|nr:teichoic acid biosynthesis protein [Desulfovibrio sp.]